MVTDDTDLRLTIEAALEQLPDKEREALRLLAWDGLSTADVAVVLGCTRATLAVRMHRARRRLAQIIDGPDPAEVDERPSWGITETAEER